MHAKINRLPFRLKQISQNSFVLILIPSSTVYSEFEFLKKLLHHLVPKVLKFEAPAASATMDFPWDSLRK